MLSIPVEVLGWIFLIVTLFLILVVLVEISRNNRRREIGKMFATEEFDQKIQALQLTSEERQMLERLVRQSSFSNKDSVLNSPILFEEAVNFVYKLNHGAENISRHDQEIISTLRKKLSHLENAALYSYTSTRQFAIGKNVSLVLQENSKELSVHTQINQLDEVSWGVKNTNTFLAEYLSGKRVDVRLNIPGEAVYHANVRVIQVTSDSILLEHSTQLHKEQLRRWMRLAVNFPVKLEYKGKIIEGFLVDLSAGGILLSLPNLIPESALVQIQFLLPGFGEENLQVRILRQLHGGTPDAETGRILHSASFIGDFGETQERVLQYIFRERRAQKGT